jgi:hypothetical protein
MTRDIDREWHEKHGQAEQPNEFNRRWMLNQLTAEEQATCADCKTADEAFALCYPDYVSLDSFRNSTPVVEPAE